MMFSNNYFKKEIREGFEVSEMMKRAWAAELEVLQAVIDICNNNNLQYFADWGTLLGAVRHQGFIPWDDDIDICLKREEYNKLLEILPQQLPHGLVVAGMYADSDRLKEANYTAQIRVIADETLIEFNDYMKWFHGFPFQRVGIDIFPLDYINVDSNTAEMQRTMFRYGMYIATKWDALVKNGELEEYLRTFGELCNVKFDINHSLRNDIWKMTDAIAALCYNDEADEVTEYVNELDNTKYRMKKEWYDNTIMMPFENIEIAVPEKYHEVLTAQFGDYMIPVRGVADHEYPFYKKLESELIKQINNAGFKGSVDEFCELVSSGKLKV